MIVKLHIEDARYIAQNMRQCDREEIYPMLWEPTPEAYLGLTMSDESPRFAALLPDGEPAVMGGCKMVCPGVGLLWMVATDRYRAVMFGVSRWMRRELLPRMWQAGLHRLQATANTRNVAACRYLEWLGLEREGVMRDMAPGLDMALYSTVRV